MTARVPEGVDLTRGVAITSSFHVNDTTHVENCRYGKGSNLMGALAVMQVDGGGRVPRWVRFAGTVSAASRGLRPVAVEPALERAHRHRARHADAPTTRSRSRVGAACSGGT